MEFGCNFAFLLVTSSPPSGLRRSVTPRAYGVRRRSLDPLRLLAASSELPDEARHPLAAAFIDGARSASARDRVALANNHDHL